MKKLLFLFGFLGLALVGYCAGNQVTIPLRADADGTIDACTGKEIKTFRVWLGPTDYTSYDVWVYCSDIPEQYGATIQGTVSDDRDTYSFEFWMNNMEGPIPYPGYGQAQFVQIKTCTITPTETDRYIFELSY